LSLLLPLLLLLPWQIEFSVTSHFRQML